MHATVVIAMPRRRLSRLQRREELAGYLFVLPWVAGFLMFTAVPFVISFGLSFFEADMLSPAKFVGLRNFRDILSTDETVSLFWKTLWNTGYYTLLSVPLEIVIGFAMALLLNRKIRLLGLFRTVFYLPAVVSGAAVALLWIWIFNPEYGILNYILSRVGVQGPGWIYSEQWSKPALIIMSLWGAGSGMLIYLAGLQGIPTQLYEAAEMDGASGGKRLRWITIPMMTPTFFFNLVMGIIGSFQVFTSAFMMTRGGPNNSTLMYVLYLYELGFNQFRMGMASVVAWLYLILIMILVAIVFKSSPLWVYYETEVFPRKKK